MAIPKNCSECPYTGICKAPYYGGSRCRYEKKIHARTIKDFLNITKTGKEGKDSCFDLRE